MSFSTETSLLNNLKVRFECRKLLKLRNDNDIYVGISYIPKVTQQSWGSFAPATRQYCYNFLIFEILIIIKSFNFYIRCHDDKNLRIIIIFI